MRSGSSCWNGNRSCTLLPEILGDPAEDRLVPQLAVQGLEHPVPFVLEDERLARHAPEPERREELEALIDGHTEIELVGDHQRGRLEVRSGSVRRELRELLARRPGPRHAAELGVAE